MVPKYFVPDEDGSLGERNLLVLRRVSKRRWASTATATCVMNYDGATGWLVGEADKGLRAMFAMMNEARLGVGIQGLSQSEVAYQNAVTFAQDRLQGRALSGPAEVPTSPPIRSSCIPTSGAC